ncbi:MAG TPA: hypothetical protein VNQ90_05820, partial [Chthoniobacteraceae bacterium]|nr:hypothetical protein [Chthoniobacteraceae bacterium]
IARTQRGRAPGVLALQEGAFSKDDVLTTGTSNLYMIFAGAFTGTPAEGLKKTVLVHSSDNAALVDPMMAQMAPDSITKSFKPTGQPFDLAIRLTGKFKTAFPDGKPSDKEETAAAEEKKGDAKPDETKKATAEATPQGLKESTAENTVLLIGDCDLLHDQVTVMEQTNPFTGGKVLYPANGNLAFVQAAVEQLAGDSDLIAVRSRASRDRPFTVVQAIEAKAVAAYQNKMMELEGSLAETESKLNALQQEKGGENGQRFILSEEQQKEVERFRATEVDVRRQLKEVRRELRSESDALKNRVQWINIALMPTLVAATGLVLAAFQRKRTAAK